MLSSPFVLIPSSSAKIQSDGGRNPNPQKTEALLCQKTKEKIKNPKIIQTPQQISHHHKHVFTVLRRLYFYLPIYLCVILLCDCAWYVKIRKAEFRQSSVYKKDLTADGDVEGNPGPTRFQMCYECGCESLYNDPYFCWSCQASTHHLTHMIDEMGFCTTTGCPCEQWQMWFEDHPMSEHSYTASEVYQYYENIGFQPQDMGWVIAAMENELGYLDDDSTVSMETNALSEMSSMAEANQNLLVFQEMPFPDVQEEPQVELEQDPLRFDFSYFDERVQQEYCYTFETWFRDMEEPQQMDPEEDLTVCGDVAKNPGPNKKGKGTGLKRWAKRPMVAPQPDYEDEYVEDEYYEPPKFDPLPKVEKYAFVTFNKTQIEVTDGDPEQEKDRADKLKQFSLWGVDIKSRHLHIPQFLRQLDAYEVDGKYTTIFLDCRMPSNMLRMFDRYKNYYRIEVTSFRNAEQFFLRTAGKMQVTRDPYHYDHEIVSSVLWEQCEPERKAIEEERDLEFLEAWKTFKMESGVLAYNRILHEKGERMYWAELECEEVTAMIWEYGLECAEIIEEEKAERDRLLALPTLIWARPTEEAKAAHKRALREYAGANIVSSLELGYRSAASIRQAQMPTPQIERVRLSYQDMNAYAKLRTKERRVDCVSRPATEVIWQSERPKVLQLLQENNEIHPRERFPVVLWNFSDYPTPLQMAGYPELVYENLTYIARQTSDATVRGGLRPNIDPIDANLYVEAHGLTKVQEIRTVRGYTTTLITTPDPGRLSRWNRCKNFLHKCVRPGTIPLVIGGLWHGWPLPAEREVKVLNILHVDSELIVLEEMLDTATKRLVSQFGVPEEAVEHLKTKLYARLESTPLTNVLTTTNIVHTVASTFKVDVVRVSELAEIMVKYLIPLKARVARSVTMTNHNTWSLNYGGPPLPCAATGQQ